MKKIFLFAALAGVLMFSACENETPFDTQSEDDAPIILRPYNESGSGSYNPSRPSDKPYVDSVVVIPTAYTTVYWYLDGELVYTGNKIEMYFPVGKYALRIEAVTKAGKMTYRTGTLTITPIATDPSSDTPAGGRYAVPSQPLTFNGKNLSQVQEVILSKGVTYEAPAIYTLTPTAQADDQLTVTMPNIENGKYYVRFKDTEGKLYGCDNVEVTSQAIALSGYEQFVPSQEWAIAGINLQNVASVKVGETVITELTVTADTVKLIAPAVEIGEYTLSMTNKDGSAVNFQTADGLVEQVTTKAQEQIITEVTIWEGHEYILWNADRVRVEASTMAEVPVGSTILIYYEELPEGHEGYIEDGTPNPYHKMQIITATWGTTLIDGFDVTADTPNPYTFTYTESMQAAIQEQFAMSVVGWGLFINKITYK